MTTTTTTVQGKTTSKPKACPPSWVHYDVTGFCYLVVNETLQWGDAEDWCFSHGAHLASIHSLAENSFVTNMIPFDPNEHGCNTRQFAYIGLYSVTNQQHWRWTDNTPFDFSAWAPGRPCCKQSICGIIWNGPPCGAPLETWADDVCFDLNQHFICKRPPN
uniref:C-type lectin domain-containing protein n=1 Tax=Panagrolaimus davidi TaxID=227884 RepID=A0A914R7E5_9BILA